MEQNKSFLPALLVVAAGLAIAAVYFAADDNRLSTNRVRPTRQDLPTARATQTTQTAPTAPASSSLDDLKTHEFLEETPAYAQNTPLASSGFEAPNYRRSGDSARPAASQREIKGRNSLVGNTARSQTTTSSDNDRISALPATSTAGENIAGRRTARSTGNGAGAGASSSAFQKEVLSPYLANLSPQDAANLNKRLDDISNSIQEAVLRALLPKSKKDANIEKYLAKKAAREGKTQAASADPFEEVARQIGNQKGSIQASMQKAYGAQAATQAGQIMDAYQQELLSTLKQPNQTQAQLQDKTRQISQKYNKKLVKLSQDSAQKRFQTDLETRDTDLLKEYAKSYDDKICAGLNNIMAKYRAQELALAKQGLNQEEYLNEYLKQKRKQDEEMRDFLRKNGQSEKPYLNAPGQKIQQQETKEDKLPVVYRASKAEQQAYQTDAHARTEKVIEHAQQVYGKEVASLFAGPQKEYEETVRQIWAERDETTYQEKKELEKQAVEKFNQQVQAIQRAPQVRDMLETKQAESSLQKLKEDPAFNNATPEQIAAFDEQARPILKDMYRQMNDVNMNDRLSNEQKEQEMQKIQQAAMRKLAGGAEQ